MAAFIWVVIKLPQEYWIHVAKLDTTDLIKEHILGVPLDESWFSAIMQNLWIVPVAALLVVAISALIRFVSRWLPSPDWRVSFNAEVDAPPIAEREIPAGRQPWFWLLEKTMLIGLISVVFGETLPGVDASVVQLIVAVGVIVVANSLVSQWLALRGTQWSSTVIEFAVMSLVNLILANIYMFIAPYIDHGPGAVQLLFLILLLTLIVTMYDHFRPIHDYHVAQQRARERDTHVVRVERPDARLEQPS